MDRQCMIPRNVAQKIQIADDEIGFSDNAQFKAAVTSELLQNAARDLIEPLRRLVRIGRRAERNGFPGLDSTQVTPQQIRSVLLDVDLPLELRTVAHFHEFVSVAGITVLAGELAAAIRIDRPGERQST